MAQWQVPFASRPSRAALGYRLHYGPGGLLQYSTTPAVAPDGSRSFCLSTEKVTMQELNGRLALYLQQVHFLEAANQRLEHQIQMELNKKCPRELRELDGHLKTVSLLQDQISECLSSQAQVKLELLSAELVAFDLNVRCDNECERRGTLEAELKNLKLQEEELQVHRLPELQDQLSDQTQRLMELRIQHQQDMRGLLAQVSGGVAVEVQPNESLDLIQQLDQLRRTNEMLLNEKQNESWFSTQMSMLSSPEVTFDPPPGSEVIQAELKELRRTAVNLEQELNQLQALNMVLEASGQEQYESVVQQLVVLQQRANDLSADLESVLQATAQQAEELQILLDIKSRLENEIRDYRRLLDELIPQGVSSLLSNSAANVASYCVTTSPSTFRRNIEVDRTVRVQGRNLRMNDFQTVSKGHVHTTRQTPVISPLSETVATVQEIGVHGKTTSSPPTLINASNLTGSSDRSGRGSMTIMTTINKQSSPVEDKGHPEDHELKSSSIVSTQISQSLDEGAVLKASEPEMNTTQEIPTLLTDIQSVKSVTVEEKTEMFTSKQTESVLQANETGTNIQTKITKTVLCAEPDVKEEPRIVTTTTTTDPSKQTAGEVNTRPAISAQTDRTKGSVQTKHQDTKTVQEVPTLVPDIQSVTAEEKTETFTSKQMTSEAGLQANETGTQIQTEISKTVPCMEAKHQEPAQVVSLSLESPAEGVRDAEDVSTTASIVSGAHIHGCEEAQSKISCDLTLVDEKDIENQENKGEEEKVEVGSTLLVVREDQSLTLSDTSTSEQNKVMENADTGSSPDRQSASSAAVEEKTQTSKQMSTEANLQANETEITKTILCPEQDVKQGITTTMTTTDPSQQTTVEVKTEAEHLISAAMESTEGSIQTNHQDPTQLLSVCLETTAEVVRDVGEAVGTASSVVSVSTASSGSPVSNDNLESETSTEILKEEKLEVNEGKVLNGVHNTTEVKVDPDMVSLESQEASLSTTESKMSSSNPDGCLSPVDTEMNMADQLFCPVDPEKNIRSPDSVLSPNDPEMFLSPHDSDTCLSPVEGNVCLSPNGGEEDEEVSLNLTEANAHVRPVEKYILSTKEDSGSMSLTESRTLNGTNKSKSSSQGIGFQLSSSFGGLYGKSVIDAKHLGDGNKDTGGIAENKDVQDRGKESPSNKGGNSEEVLVKSVSFGNVPADGGTTTVAKASEGSKESTSVATVPATSQQETGRFGSRGSGEWIVYGGNLRRKSSLDGGATLPKKGKEEGPSVATNTPTNPPDTGRFSSRGSGEWTYYGGSLGRKSSLPSTGNEKSQSVPSLSETSQPETKTFGSRGSGEWRVYGGSTGRMSRPARSDSLPGVESPSVATQLATSPPGTSGFGRFGSEGSGEWRVYGGSTGSLSSASSADRVSVSTKAGHIISPPGSHTRVSSAGSGGRLSSGSVVKRSSSLGSGGRLSSSGSGGRLSGSSGSHRTSSSGRFTSAGSGEWKPVYSSSNARKSSVGSTGRSGGRTTSSQRAPSPGGRMVVNMGSGGWLNTGVSHTGSSGSGSKLSSSGGSDRISSRAGGRISGSSGSGRTNSTGGRVISSSDRPIRSTGSGAGGNKERISVCKMAALTISAAGRERSQDKQGQTQLQQQQAAASPLVQQWLTAGAGITSADSEGLDDIMRL